MKKRLYPICAILAVAFISLLGSCAFSKTIPLAGKTYPAITVEEVVIFVDPKDLPVEFEKVAIISTDYTSTYDKAKWKNVRKKCAEMGCNGVYQSFEKRASQGERIAGAIFGTGSRDKAEFIAIRYTKKQP
jgi:hypothetical protein